jgi:hypothetical protein
MDGLTSNYGSLDTYKMSVASRFERQADAARLHVPLT